MRKVSMKRKSRSKNNEEENGSATEEVENGSEESVDDTTVEEESKSKRKRSSRKDNDDQDSDQNEEDASDKKNGHKGKKKGKKTNKQSKKQESTDKEDEDDDDADYEVEDVVDEKWEKGVHLYLIRWKGYDASGDTWEPESTLSCPDIVKKYHDKHGHKEAPKKGAKGRKKKTTSKDSEETWDENEEFEVDKILEVHHRRDGSKEFLVSWKGYPPSENTWEPEDNLNCKDMIERFMKKVETLKGLDTKVLREKRKHTDFFTLSTKETGRRLSKRQNGKQRVHYHDAE